MIADPPAPPPPPLPPVDKPLEEGQNMDADMILEEAAAAEEEDEDAKEFWWKMLAMTSSVVGESIDSEIPLSRLPKSEVTDKDPKESLPPPPPPPPPRLPPLPPSNEEVTLLEGLVGFRRPRRPPR